MKEFIKTLPAWLLAMVILVAVLAGFAGIVLLAILLGKYSFVIPMIFVLGLLYLPCLVVADEIKNK